MLALSHKHNRNHIYRINDSHRTATNPWQRNLKSNNGKKFVTFRAEREKCGGSEKVNLSRMDVPERELWKRKGSRTL